VEYCKIATGSVVFYCDNEGALDNVFDEFPKRGIYLLFARDYDLLGAARALWQSLPIMVNKQWVKGHYKGNQREIKHDLNDLADSLATHSQNAPPAGCKPHRVPLQHPEYEAILKHAGTELQQLFEI